MSSRVYQSDQFTDEFGLDPSVYAEYGVFTEVTSGYYTYYYSNCTQTNYGYITAWVPDGQGWNTWN